MSQETIKVTNKVMTTETVTANKRIHHYTISKACLICGDSVELDEIETAVMMAGHHVDSKICDKCRQAILHIRKQLYPENNITEE